MKNTLMSSCASSEVLHQIQQVSALSVLTKETTTKQFGVGAFCKAAPSLCISLSVSLMECIEKEAFMKTPKTYLYSES